MVVLAEKSAAMATPPVHFLVYPQPRNEHIYNLVLYISHITVVIENMTKITDTESNIFLMF